MNRWSELALIALVWVFLHSPGWSAETSAPAAGRRSRVVLVRDPDAMAKLVADPARVDVMVTRGLAELTGEKTAPEAWRTFVSSNDVVGIKISSQAAPLQATRPALVESLVRGLQAAGVAATNIVIFGRDPRKMAEAGFPVGRPAPALPCAAILDGEGWDPAVFYENRLVGKLIWGDLLFGQEEHGINTRSHFPRILTGRITKLVNVPVLMDHEECGLMGCLYSQSLTLVDNVRRFESLGRRGDPFIAEISAMPVVREKVVLHVLDALTAGYAGGPAFKPQFSWPFGALYFSRDPVAIDALALERVEARRAEARVPAVGSRASYITTAARHGLGQAERESIELIEIGPAAASGPAESNHPRVDDQPKQDQHAD